MRIGIIFALFTVLGIYFAISVKEMRTQVVDSAESLALVPIYILFTSSLPWFFLHQAYLLPCVYAAIMGICLWYIYEKKLNLEELWFKKDKFLKYTLIGILIGIPTGTIEYFILTPAPAYPSFEFVHLFKDIINMYFFVALGEELLFRALIQRNISIAFCTTAGLLSASIIFAIMHLTWRSVPELVFVFFGGMIFGYLYYKTGSLSAPIATHAMNNIRLVGVLPYLL